jgi:YVTN family beta-propeller protein
MRLFYFVLCTAAVAWIGAGCASQQPIGLIGSDVDKVVAAFDTGTHTARGGINVPSTGDRDAYAFAIDPSGAHAYVSNRFDRIHRVAFGDTALSVSGTLITASHTASDLAMMTTGPRLLVAVGIDTASTAGVLSTIDPATGTELDRARLGNATPYSVAACDDGRTVLVGTDAPQAVHKFTLDDRGRLKRADAALTVRHSVANVYCAPGSQTGMIVFSASASLQSFDVRSMRGVGTRRLAAQSATPVRSSPFGLSGVFARDGGRFFARSERGDFTGTGFVEAFDVDAATGVLGPATHRRTVEPLAAASRGTDEIAISADGSRLYVTDAHEDRVLVLDPHSLAPIDTISGLGDAPFGIAVGGG